MTAKLYTRAELCCEGGEILPTNYDMPPNGRQNKKHYSTHTKHHWHWQHHPTHNKTLPNTQHIWIHKPWRTHLLLPQVSMISTKSNMDHSHMLWKTPRMAWTNRLYCQLPYQNHHRNSPRASQSMLARIMVYQRSHQWVILHENIHQQMHPSV